jgi:hypothetical protein
MVDICFVGDMAALQEDISCIWSILCHYIVDVICHIWLMTHSLGTYFDLNLTELWPLTCKYLNSIIAAILLCHTHKKNNFYSFFSLHLSTQLLQEMLSRCYIFKFWLGCTHKPFCPLSCPFSFPKSFGRCRVLLVDMSHNFTKLRKFILCYHLTVVDQWFSVCLGSWCTFEKHTDNSCKSGTVGFNFVWPFAYAHWLRI